MKRTPVLSLFLLLWTGFCLAQSVSTATSPPNLQTGASGLFGRQEPLTFTLAARMTDVVRNRAKPLHDSLAVKHPAQLTYFDTTLNDRITLPLTVQVRGNFRRNAVNCAFPPLYLDFPKKKMKATLFDKQNKLKLVTHCQGDDYVLREYYVYKLYNLVTDLSFRARLARISYVDSLRRRQTEIRWGFLIEDEGDVAKRNQLAEVKKGVEASDADSLGMARLAVFEFMIGNIDWSVTMRHNIRLVAGPDGGKPGVIPYDFDHAALVDAPYAQYADPSIDGGGPERVYRGPLYPGWLMKRIFTEFNALKPQFYAFYETDKRLNRGYVKQTLKYLDSFFVLINDQKAVRSHFFNGDTDGKLFTSFK